jgi:hypothetical protein
MRSELDGHLWQAATVLRTIQRPDQLHKLAFSSMGVTNEDELLLVAAPSALVIEPVRFGDLLVRRAPSAGVLHSAVVLSEQTASAAEMKARGVPVESAGGGAYVEVMEVPFGGGPVRIVGRRLTDSWGRMLPEQTILRPSTVGASVGDEPASEASEQAAGQIDWCRMRQTIAANARTEEARWTSPTGVKLLESAATQRLLLVAYWMATGQGATAAGSSAQQSASDVDTFAWSAAFICFILHVSGIRPAHGFNFGSAHMRYIVGALRNRERRDSDRPFWLVDGVEVQREAVPEPGDLLCFNRPVNGVMTNHSYTNLRNQFWGTNGQNQNVQPTGFSHCSLVVGTFQQGTQRFLETIGGNEGDSVRLKRNVRIDQHGGIPNPQQHADPGPIFGMIKITRC